MFFNISRLIFTRMNLNCRKKIGKTSTNFLLKRINSHSMSRHRQQCRDTSSKVSPMSRRYVVPPCCDFMSHPLVTTSDFQCCDIVDIQEKNESMLRHRIYRRATPRLILKQCRDIVTTSSQCHNIQKIQLENLSDVATSLRHQCNIESVSRHQDSNVATLQLEQSPYKRETSKFFHS